MESQAELNNFWIDFVHLPHVSLLQFAEVRQPGW